MSFLSDQSLLISTRAFASAAKTPTFAVEILAFCSQPRTQTEVAARYGTPAEKLFQHLVDAGLLVSPDAAAATPAFFSNFSALDVHRRMLADTARLDAYARAILATVAPESVVLDAGTGSGILATLAAKAGARRVHAIDNADILEVAREVFASSGVGDRVRLHRGDFRTTSVSEPVDVIVTETFGALGLAEGGPADLVDCCTTNLAPNGRVVPEEIVLYIAPVGARELLDEAVGPFALWQGVDLSTLRNTALHRAMTTTVSPSALLASGAAFHRVRLGQDPYGDGQASWDAIRGEIVGFAAWFDLHLTKEIVLSTGPLAPPTHWRQQFLPLEPRTIEGPLDLSLHVDAARDDRRSLEIALEWRTTNASGETWWRVR